ncbi:acyl carrier protein [Salinactinospora qingdaonensis]|uniref:Carrier domain-containing protein n=1 Tax=Salinactinospora qingdaonensis TaxID=702744 RepID=A0ABP7EW29_9ACTN
MNAATETYPYVEQTIRELLAEAVLTEPGELDHLPAETSLFAPEIGLESLSGMRLLAAVHRRFGVDVAAEDLNLDALESIAALTGFVATRVAEPPSDGP